MKETSFPTDYLISLFERRFEMYNVHGIIKTICNDMLEFY